MTKTEATAQFIPTDQLKVGDRLALTGATITKIWWENESWWITTDDGEWGFFPGRAYRVYR